MCVNMVQYGVFVSGKRKNSSSLLRWWKGILENLFSILSHFNGFNSHIKMKSFWWTEQCVHYIIISILFFLYFLCKKKKLFLFAEFFSASWTKIYEHILKVCVTSRYIIDYQEHTLFEKENIESGPKKNKMRRMVFLFLFWKVHFRN